MKRSSMFLLELLAMIVIFSLCATVCLRMIGASWQMSQESARLTEAVYLAESAAARLQNGEDPLTGFLPEGGAMGETGYGLSVEPLDAQSLEESPILTHTAAEELPAGLAVYRVAVIYEGAIIYELDVTCEEGVS